MSLMMTWTSCSRRCSEQGACLPKSKASLLNGFEENIDRLAPCAGRNWLQRHLSFDKKTIPHNMFCDACLVDFDQHVPIVFFWTPLTHDVSSYLMAAPMPGPVAARAHHSDRLCDLCRRAVFRWLGMKGGVDMGCCGYPPPTPTKSNNPKCACI